MKRLLVLALLVSSYFVNAQNKSELIKHYEAYYKQMKIQGDAQGVINALTHLNVVSPSEARKDTLAYIYLNEGKHLQALNTVGIELSSTDSNLAKEVKAVSLKALGQAKLALPHFEALFNANPNPNVAYELAELSLQLGNLVDARKHSAYGVNNSKDDMKMAFYETQQPYQVPLKAAFTYLRALIKFNEDKKANIDTAVLMLDEAIKLAPNFNLAQVSKKAILSLKVQSEDGTTPKN